MPEPIDLQFDKISMSSSETQASKTETKNAKEIDSSKSTFFTRQLDEFKSKLMVSGSFYNIATFSILTFIIVLIILVVFRPPLVLVTPKPTHDVPNPEPCLSWGSVLTWSFLMGLVVAGISFFTRPKDAPNYVLEK